MATIRAYTTIEQSRKLAEILPPESADMEYMFLKKDNSMVSRVPFVKDGIEEPDCPYNMVSCWSLAALLDILPRRIELEGVAYELSIYLNGLYYWNVNNGNLFFKSKDKDNFVDACYELILKLHELKML